MRWTAESARRSCDEEPVQQGTRFLDDDRGSSRSDDEDAAVLDCATAIVGWDLRMPCWFKSGGGLKMAAKPKWILNPRASTYEDIAFTERRKATARKNVGAPIIAGIPRAGEVEDRRDIVFEGQEFDRLVVEDGGKNAREDPRWNAARGAGV